MVGEAVVAAAERNLHAVAPLQPTAALSELLRRVLQLETGEDPDACGATALDHLPQLVGTHGGSVFDVAHDAPVDEAVKDFLLLADDTTDLGLVEVDIGKPEAEGELIDSGAGEFIDRPAHLVQVQRRIETLEMEVVGVTVVDETGRWRRAVGSHRDSYQCPGM